MLDRPIALYAESCPAKLLDTFALNPRAATTSCAKFETELLTNAEDVGDAITYVVEVLAFEKQQLGNPEEVTVLLHDPHKDEV